MSNVIYLSSFTRKKLDTKVTKAEQLMILEELLAQSTQNERAAEESLALKAAAKEAIARFNQKHNYLKG